MEVTKLEYIIGICEPIPSVTRIDEVTNKQSEGGEEGNCNSSTGH